MSKKLMMLSAMAGMLAASANEVYGAPILPANRPREDKRTNNEKKKCKSCKHFSKGSNGRCSCKIHIRTYGVGPMEVACGEYKKRNK